MTITKMQKDVMKMNDCANQYYALAGRRTLFVTPTGSSLYGTHTPLSDTDYKEVFLPELGKLLIGKMPKNIPVSTGNDSLKNTSKDIDCEYIPIQVFANDFINGQTYAIELAFSLLHNKGEYYLYEQDFLQFVQELTEKFLTSNIKAMIGYAMNQAQIYGIKGTRLSDIRRFSDYLEQVLSDGTFKPDDKLENLIPWVKENSSTYLKTSTHTFNNKTLTVIKLVEKIYPCSITFLEAASRTLTLKNQYGTRARDAESAKGIDWKATSHAVRITMQAINLLNHGKLEFPFKPDDVQLLLSIKKGEMIFDQVEEIMVDLFEKLELAKINTSLPEKNYDMETNFEIFLIKWMNKFYNI